MANSRLSRIDTQWSVVRQAHGNNAGGCAAQAALFDQYGSAIKRYLLASMKNEDAAAEVFQEFALRLVRGDFRTADSHKGKFRSFIKTTIYRLMMDYYRRTKKHRELESVAREKGAHVSAIRDYDDFTIAWRQSLLDEAWNRLNQLELQSGKPYFTVLRSRADQPQLTTRLLHASLKSECDNLPAESAFRVFLYRARKRFALILIDQVAASLEKPCPEDIESELIELGLHHFTKPLAN